MKSMAAGEGMLRRDAIAERRFVLLYVQVWRVSVEPAMEGVSITEMLLLVVASVKVPVYEDACSAVAF